MDGFKNIKVGNYENPQHWNLDAEYLEPLRVKEYLDIMDNNQTNKREQILLDIQNDVLKGGICVQDWTTFQLENAYLSYCAGATLSCIVMCQATIESYMRDDEQLSNRNFYDIIETCSYNQEMKKKLHELRKYRNKWTHINEQDNAFLIDEKELEEMALFSYRLALEVFHYYPFI